MMSMSADATDSLQRSATLPSWFHCVRFSAVGEGKEEGMGKEGRGKGEVGGNSAVAIGGINALVHSCFMGK